MVGSIPLIAKRGRPPKKKEHLSIENQKPWVEEGISRRSWYRHRAAKRDVSRTGRVPG